MPFLSDDWANLRAGAANLLGRTPYGDFRPVTQATYAIDRAIWGTWAPAWHLTNIVFVVAATALLMALIQRHFRDRSLAAVAGLLFALHPYHIASVAWVSGRAEPIGAAFLFAALLAYDRWRERARGVPVAACLLFEAALSSHAAAIVLPLLVPAIGWARDRRPPRVAETIRGFVPLLAVALLHVFGLRTLALGSSGPAPAAWFGPHWFRHLTVYATAAIAPLNVELFGDGPSLLGGLGAAGAVALAGTALLLGALIVSARAAAGRVPPAFWCGALFFVVLTLPSLDRLRAGSLFLPSAAAALALAALLRAAGRRAAIGASVCLALVWSAAAIDHWIGWRAAARASIAIVADLTEASRRPGVDRIVVANLPRLVRGMPVGLEYTAAIETSGGRPVAVEYVTYLDYPQAYADDLDGPPEDAVRRTPEGVTVDLLVPERLHSRNVDPGPADPDVTIEARHGTIRFLEPNHMRLLIPPPPRGTVNYLWRRGRLVALDPPP